MCATYLPLIWHTLSFLLTCANAVARMLALLLLLEALVCWPAWRTYPTWCAASWEGMQVMLSGHAGCLVFRIR